MGVAEYSARKLQAGNPGTAPRICAANIEAYNGDLVAFKMGRQQDGPSRTDSLILCLE